MVKFYIYLNRRIFVMNEPSVFESLFLLYFQRKHVISHIHSLFNALICCGTINEVSQEMRQLWSTAFQGQWKRTRWGTNNAKMQWHNCCNRHTKKSCNRWTVLERSQETNTVGLNTFMSSGLFYLNSLARFISYIVGVLLGFIITMLCRNFWT